MMRTDFMERMNIRRGYGQDAFGNRFATYMTISPKGRVVHLDCDLADLSGSPELMMANEIQATDEMDQPT